MNNAYFPPKQDSPQLTSNDAIVIKALLKLGFHDKRIAALFDCNQGRVSEIKTGKKFRTASADDIGTLY